MTSILEQAQTDLVRSRREAQDAQRTFKAAVARLRTAQDRVDRLLITQMEIDHEQEVLARRRRAGR